LGAEIWSDVHECHLDAVFEEAIREGKKRIVLLGRDDEVLDEWQL